MERWPWRWQRPEKQTCGACWKFKQNMLKIM
jgi:hypothetical protein